jgi:hypothetical protein
MAIRTRLARMRARTASDSAFEPPTSTSLFAYAMLADDRRVAGLLERPIAGSDAELLDFEELRAAGSPNAAVVEAAGERVAGKLYRHLGDEDFARLDAYQGVAEQLYFRELAQVVRPGGDAGAAEEAWVYLPTGRTLKRFSG